MLNMFNKRKRSENQDKKVTAIIHDSIKPFLQKELAGKVKKQLKAGIAPAFWIYCLKCFFGQSKTFIIKI